MTQNSAQKAGVSLCDAIGATPVVNDVIIVGGSFAGLAAALQLGRARRRVLVIDGEEPRNRFAPRSYGFLTQDGEKPSFMLDRARANVRAYPGVELRSGKATRATALNGGFVIRLDTGEEVSGKRLVLATGLIDDLPPIPGVKERWGVTAVHCPYCHAFELRDQPLGILASNAASNEGAMLLSDWGPTTLFTQGVCHPDASQQEALAARGIRVETRAIEALLGAAPSLTGVRLEDGSTVEIGALFLSPFTRLASPLAAQLGCRISRDAKGEVIETDADQLTSIEGVYAVGDAALCEHNISLAVASGVTAGIAAHQSLAQAHAARGAAHSAHHAA